VSAAHRADAEAPPKEHLPDDEISNLDHDHPDPIAKQHVPRTSLLGVRR